MASPQKSPPSSPTSSAAAASSASPTRKHNFGDGEVTLHRAKAFLLNTETNDWDEMATGYCSPDPSEVSCQFSKVERCFIFRNCVLLACLFACRTRLYLQLEFEPRMTIR